jgi:hypothetical protein
MRRGIKISWRIMAGMLMIKPAVIKIWKYKWFLSSAAEVGRRVNR